MGSLNRIRAKRAYNHNTAKGGGKNGSSKLLPIVYSFLHELLWHFNYGDQLFKQFENRCMLYGKRVDNVIVDNDAIELLAKTILNLSSDEDIFGVDSFVEEVENEMDNELIDGIMTEI